MSVSEIIASLLCFEYLKKKNPRLCSSYNEKLHNLSVNEVFFNDSQGTKPVHMNKQIYELTNYSSVEFQYVFPQVKVKIASFCCLVL